MPPRVTLAPKWDKNRRHSGVGQGCGDCAAAKGVSDGMDLLVGQGANINAVYNTGQTKS